IDEFTFTTDVSGRVKFEDVNDEKDASSYVNLDVFLPRDVLSDLNHVEGGGWHLFVGYDVLDQQGKLLGTISDVDDSTLNVLFVLLNDGEELLIPATEDFITAVDEDKKIIEMSLPEGLFDH